MTHKDIYTKFMIEYDKAGASTSYPSLTEYEVATVLDKAYNALIAQKVTGNNYRRATFESDIKSIADLGPLVDTKILTGQNDTTMAPNIYKFKIDKYEIAQYDDSECVSDVFTTFITIEESFGAVYHYINTEGGITTPNPTIGWDEESGTFVAVSEYNFSAHTTDATVQGRIDALNAKMEDNETPWFYIRKDSENGQWYKCSPGDNVWKLEVYDGEPPVTHTEKDTNLLYFLQGSMLYNGPKEIREHTPYGNDTTVDTYKIHYFTSANITANTTIETTAGGVQQIRYDGTNTYNPIDGITAGRGVPVKLVNHEMAQKFFTSASNIPWIKEPVCFIEGKSLFVVYDPLNPPSNIFRVTYIKQPNTFVKDLTDATIFPSGTWTYFNPSVSATDAQKALYEFECNSTVAEELVSLAVAFALENVESQRLNSKLNMRGLEA